MTEIIPKGWGSELIFADTEDYCGKLLRFDRCGNKCSMHFHINKHETWYVQQGSFIVNYIDPLTSERKSRLLVSGDVWVNEPGHPHQLVAVLDNSVVFEASTYDDPLDNYRVEPGDSQ